MFQHQGIWLPDGEKHFPEWMTRNGEIVNGKGTYQIKKFREAMRWCGEGRRVVDVGAHVGLWSMHLSQHFDVIEAFEPVPQFQACWAKNMEGLPWIGTLHSIALGAAEGVVSMKIDPADTGGTHADYHPLKDTVPLKPLDSFEFQDVDFIKIDVEGAEIEVVKGAEGTLRRCHPCVIVEQKPHKLWPNFGIKGTPAVDFLRSLGAVLRKEMGGDYIMSWDA